MTRQDQIWNDFNLEKNCVQITDQNAVRLYFAQFTLALDSLARICERDTGPANTEYRAINAFAGRLVATNRLLALKYFFERPGDNLKIDSTDSGFPHFSTLVYLEADLKGREQVLSESEPVGELKRQMADRIVRLRASPRDLQERIARRLYFEGLSPDAVFGPYVPGELTMVGDVGTRSSYFWSFATYDRSLNRPFLYMLYFTHPKRSVLSTGSDEIGRMAQRAEKIASGRLNLLSFSRMLDDSVEPISIKIVKRVVLGPWWSPHFTENEGELGRLLAAQKDRSPFALRWETETLLSDRELMVGRGILSKGRLRQVFWVPKDLDLATRGVSNLERSILMPHWLGQYVAQARLLRDHQRYVIDKEDEVYGVH